MKHFLLAILTLFALSSCRETENEIFEMDYEVDIVYEAGLSQFEVYFIDTYDVQTRIDEFLASSGRSREDISSILPKSAELINVQSDVNFDFIRDISIRVFDGTLLTPDVQENVTEIFFRENLPQERTTLVNLLPALPDVKDQLMEPRFNFTTRTELRASPSNTIEARLRLKFSVQ